MKKYKFSLFQKISFQRTMGQSITRPFCNAPFTGLLFVPSGKIMACHYNRGYILGDIKFQTIDEIWNGTQLKILREKIKNRDFSMGCQSCFNDLQSGNIFLSGNYKYNHLKVNKNRYPSYFDFQLENTCNLSCIMCSSEYSSAISNSLHLEKQESAYKQDFINQLEKYIPHLKAVSFTGGEPFFIKSYKKIWEKIHELNPHIPISISTNASFIPTENKKHIENGNFSFTVSIDSLQKDTYELIRKNAKLENTIENIEYLKSLTEKTNSKLSIKIVLMTLNHKELPQMIEFWSLKNIEVYPKLLWVPVSFSLKNLPIKQLQEIIDFYKNFKFSTQSPVMFDNLNRYHSLIYQLENWCNDKALFENREELIKLDLLSLKNKLQALIFDEINNDFNIDNIERGNLINTCEEWIIRLFSIKGNEDIIKENIVNFILLGTEILIPEIKRNPEKLTERFLKDLSFHE